MPPISVSAAVVRPEAQIDTRSRTRPGFSLVSTGARLQFAVGVALISTIPLLCLWYLAVRTSAGQNPLQASAALTIPLLLGAGLGGYAILRKYPVNIVRLRSYLLNMAQGDLPKHVELLKDGGDIEVVEEYLNLIVGQLRERLEILKDEKLKLQQQLYQAQKLESLGVMAAGAAHDFNNLLQGMVGQLDSLQSHVDTQSPANADIRQMEQFVQRASELTTQMLVYSGKGKFVMEPLDMTRLVREMEVLLNASVRKGIEIRCDLAEGLPPVHADATQKRQVVMNLVINASDAIGPVGGTITIATRSMDCGKVDFSRAFVSGNIPEGPCVCIEVRDTGCGMKQENCARIFDPFYTTKQGGRGLGLAVVLGIVHAHKGAIAVESEPGKGSRFMYLIPAPRGSSLPGSHPGAGA